MAIKINWQDLQKRIINWQEVQKVMLNWNQIRPSSSPTPTYQIVWDFATAWASGQLPAGWVGEPWNEPRITISWIQAPDLLTDGEVRTNIQSLANAKRVTIVYNFEWSAFGWNYSLANFNFLKNESWTTFATWWSSVGVDGWWEDTASVVLGGTIWYETWYDRLLPEPSYWHNYLYTLTWEIDLINKTYTSSLTNNAGWTANLMFQIQDSDITNLIDSDSFEVRIWKDWFVTVTYVEISIFE